LINRQYSSVSFNNLIQCFFGYGPVKALIRENKTHEIPAVIETSSKDGMVSFNRALVDLVRKKEISLKDAVDYSYNPTEIRNLLR
jgi:twitching motility protein PilT